MLLIKKSLSVLKQSHEVVDLYRNHLSNECLTGMITDFNDDFIYMSLFDDAGQADGISVFYRSDITRLRWGGNERDSYKILIKAANAYPSSTSEININSIDTVLRSVATAYGYVNILTERMDSSITFIGEIEDLDSESVLLNTYGSFSSRDRSHLLIKLNEITRIDADAHYERSVKLLALRD